MSPTSKLLLLASLLVMAETAFAFVPLAFAPRGVCHDKSSHGLPMATKKNKKNKKSATAKKPSNNVSVDEPNIELHESPNTSVAVVDNPTSTEASKMTEPHSEKLAHSGEEQAMNSLSQPKPPAVAATLEAKYAAIDDIGDRAFAILSDLGLVGRRH